jgi:hypothetical protein
MGITPSAAILVGRRSPGRVLRSLRRCVPFVNWSHRVFRIQSWLGRCPVRMPMQYRAEVVQLVRRPVHIAKELGETDTPDAPRMLKKWRRYFRQLTTDLSQFGRQEERRARRSLARELRQVRRSLDRSGTMWTRFARDELGDLVPCPGRCLVTSNK